MSDKVRYLAARLMAHLPDSLKIRFSGTPPVIVDGQQLDPQVQLLRAVRRRIGGTHGLIEPSVEAGRKRYRRETMNFRGPVTKVASVRDFDIDGLRVRHYTCGETNAPLTVYLHGGGFVIGDLDTHDEPCRMLCAHGATDVLAVDYRLSPEHPFPAALDDAAKALRWAQEHAEVVGIGGDSAGANLSVVTSCEATRKPAAQLLIYPPVDGITRRRSHELFGTDYFLSNKDRDGFERCYIGAPEAEPNPRVSPMYMPDLANQPPALVVVAGFDILRDECEEFAAKLLAAGNAVRIQRYPSLGHGFIHMTGVAPAARRAMIAIAVEWRALLKDRVIPSGSEESRGTRDGVAGATGSLASSG